MIVCVCRRVSDRAISAAMDRGARDVEAVAEATGAGGDCGCCRETVESLVSLRRTACSSPPCPGCPRAVQGEAA